MKVLLAVLLFLTLLALALATGSNTSKKDKLVLEKLPEKQGECFNKTGNTCCNNWEERWNSNICERKKKKEGIEELCGKLYPSINCRKTCKKCYTDPPCDDLFTCQGNGKCNPDDGSCICNKGFSGTDCSSECGTDQFDCGSLGCFHPTMCEGTCINKNYVLDGQMDCKDGSDEECGRHQFDCGSLGCFHPTMCEGTCINRNFLFDGKEDCVDGSDEGYLIFPITGSNIEPGYLHHGFGLVTAYGGIDSLKVVSNVDIERCATECGKDYNCQGFTFIKWLKRCDLKDQEQSDAFKGGLPEDIMSVRCVGECTLKSVYYEECARIPFWMISAFGASNRINHADDAPSPIPWQVYIWIGHPHGQNSSFCAGTIIDATTILSAANCYYGENLEASYFVTAGITHKYHDAGQSVFVKSINIHDLYNPDNFDYDFAILKLNTPLTFNHWIQRACLPEEESYVPQGRAVASGWGTFKQYHGENESPNLLQWVSRPLINFDMCEKSPFKWTKSDITGNMICTSNKDGRCRGDSGGPLVVPKSPKDATAVVIGVTSFEMTPCGQEDYPAVYAFVPKVLKWIKDQMD